MYQIPDLYDLSETYPEVKEYLSSFTYAWEALKGIKDLILAIGAHLSEEEYDHPAEGVWIAKTAKIFPTAYIGAPCITGPETEVRQGAFIRGSALVGKGCVVG
ncbi:MAG: UDP-N-acetylglucosamine pyrophosphorylase, partial [Lachnospiraceae bacterium]|nr:UDP-N-acetylglucosamine pyrophosphorylase [Lachnospiraceae bacterium]